MSDTVFWSWQADLDKNLNRSFIRDALARAVEKVSDELDVEDVDRVSLDHDTKSASGMADISHTILEQVSKAAVFVADVTPIVRTEAEKSIPNPNVMLELGFALKALGSNRIIAILNTGAGDRVEDLPFDIRHRRILTYSLSKDMTKIDRRSVREKLVSDLSAAIATNIKQVRVTRFEVKPITISEESADRPGLWEADWPVKHSSHFGEIDAVMPDGDDRAFLRVIPADWPNGKPHIGDFEELPDGVKIWASHGAGTGGSFGACRFGYVTYWISGKHDEETYLASNLAAFIEDTGEIWLSDATSRSGRGDQRFIAPGKLLTNWSKGLDRANRCLDHLGASPRRKVVAGVYGLEGTMWSEQSDWAPLVGRLPSVMVERIESQWGEDERFAFLHQLWNQLGNVFGRPRVLEDEFRAYYDIRKRS